MSAQETVGTVLTNPEQRDAIHFAVFAVTAGCTIYPGEHIRFATGSKERVVRVDEDRNEVALGIADPFLKDSVETGEKFWMFLLPNTITSLRHVWEHPSFDPVVDGTAPAKFQPFISPPEKWLREYAVECDVTYEELMEAGRDYIENGNYFSQGGKFEGMGVPDMFWDMFEMVEKKPVAAESRGSFFSCSC